ncbi:MAG: TIGR04086 family membrane protein [Desulfitobacteriaceae bacterium]
MGTVILRGISSSLLVTVLTLLGGMLWNAMGLGGISVSELLDIGLMLSCLVGGYQTGRGSGIWILGGLTGAGYVAVGAMLLALFLPLRSWGVLEVILEGGVLGLIAGAFGAGGMRGMASSGRIRPLYASRGNFSEDTDEDWEADGDSGWTAKDWDQDEAPVGANKENLGERGQSNLAEGPKKGLNDKEHNGDHDRNYNRDHDEDYAGEHNWDYDRGTDQNLAERKRSISGGALDDSRVNTYPSQQERNPWWEEEIRKGYSR